MHLRKNKKTIARSNSINSQYLNKKPISFQTIYKRRNQTINDSQLTDHANSTLSQSNFYKSQIISPQIRQLQKTLITPTIDIKDYVKKMVNKDQKQAQPVKPSYNRLFTNEDDDKLSRRSIKSSISTQLYKKQSSASAIVEIKTVEELQKKIDQLVGQTLQRLKKQRSSIGLVKFNQTKTGIDFFRQIEQIHEIINYFKLLTEDSQRQKIEDLDKKLQMIEKMMASQNIQSDVLKNQYYNWKSQRMNTSSFTNKKMLATQIKFNSSESKIKKAGFQEQPVKKQIVSNYHSTNSIHYTKPARQYYVKPQQKKSTFLANRQPFPRSNYSTQFLNYGNIPIYNYNQSNLKQQPQASLAVKASNYQQQYKEKLGMTKNIDFKELDCFKDKFKNTNISFMNSSKKETTQKKKLDQRFNKKNMNDAMKENIDRLAKIRASQEALLINLALSKNIPSLKSQNQKEFIWYNKSNTNNHYSNEQCMLKSEIKDRRLQKFKETFKHLAMRK